MKSQLTKLLKTGVVVCLLTSVSACVVVPRQSIAYRSSSGVMPTYVNGQYVGDQPSYVESTTTYVQPAVPLYAQPSYNYVDPLYGLGVGVGLGITLNHFRGGRSHGNGHWHGHRHGHRGWRR